MVRRIKEDIEYFLGKMDYVNYNVEKCRVMRSGDRLHIYIWSDWMDGRECEISELAFNYFNASCSELLFELCSGVWVKDIKSGFKVR